MKVKNLNPLKTNVREWIWSSGKAQTSQSQDHGSRVGPIALLFSTGGGQGGRRGGGQTETDREAY